MSFKHDPQWAKAKTLCRLNAQDVQMAKELGMSPKGLIKNRPSPSQKWKAPVKFWIRELHAKRFGRREERRTQPGQPSGPSAHDGRSGQGRAKGNALPIDDSVPEDNIPF
jgi:hypothetical protein